MATTPDTTALQKGAITPAQSEQTSTKKAVNLMEDVDEVSELFKSKEYDSALREAERVRQKIRKFRQAGLERGGVFSVENLAFKVLRRNGYLETLSSLRIMAYDKSMSLNHE